MSFENNIHLMSDTFKYNKYKRMMRFVTKHALILIIEKFVQIKHIRFDNEHCDYILRRTIIHL